MTECYLTFNKHCVSSVLDCVSDPPLGVCSTNHLSAQHHPTCGPDRETTHKKTNHTCVLEERLSPRISKKTCCSVFSYLNSFPIVMHPCTFSFTFVCSEVPTRSSFPCTESVVFTLVCLVQFRCTYMRHNTCTHLGTIKGCDVQL